MPSDSKNIGHHIHLVVQEGGFKCLTAMNALRHFRVHKVVSHYFAVTLLTSQFYTERN